MRYQSSNSSIARWYQTWVELLRSWNKDQCIAMYITIDWMLEQINSSTVSVFYKSWIRIFLKIIHQHIGLSDNLWKLNSKKSTPVNLGFVETWLHHRLKVYCSATELFQPRLEVRIELTTRKTNVLNHWTTLRKGVGVEPTLLALGVHERRIDRQSHSNC